MRYYKFLTEDNTGGYTNFVWPLPNGKPTGWLECEGKLELCRNGFHLVPETKLFNWMSDKLYLAEYDGEIVRDDDNICCRKVRLIKHIEVYNKKTLRLFAADCAERVLPIFEKQHPDDLRPRQAIEATRKYAKGELCVDGFAAAKAAAWDAVRAAAWDALSDAAKAAAWDAVSDAAWAAAWDAEREWQQQRLLQVLGLNQKDE